MITILRAMRSAIAALALAAMACGGGDPPGGGNGDTDGGGTTDGTTGNGGRTDGHVPNPSNPLIAVIPGTWTIERVTWVKDGEPMEEVPDPPMTGPLTVDADFPDCQDPVSVESQGITGFCYGDARGGIGSPGDACICLLDVVSTGWGPPVLILQGDAVRAHNANLIFYAENDGRVLDDGQEIQLHSLHYGVNENTELTTFFRKLD